jgi:NAD(P)-dependent dehydrogenase (short-subunit alcohol dehydrogenase family)
MNPTSQINSSSVFLVSGGARGITAQCVIRLAQQYSGRWILLGRSAIADAEPTWAIDCLEEAELKKRIMQDLQIQGKKPTPKGIQEIFNTISASREIQSTLQSLQQAGNQAAYLSVDVTDASALRQQLAAVVEQWGPITGIIHGAGTLADKFIEKKTERDFETVYAAKVKGLENLLDCVALEQLDYLVLFSSVASFFGNAGQTDYAIANEILNKSAHLLKQRYSACHVVAINWGPWDSGMVTPDLKKAFALRNIEVIPIDVGTQMLVEELAATHHETAQVVIGSPLTPPAQELGSELHTYRIHRTLSLSANPFLQDHRIGGNPVMPATCAASWIINTCEQLYPGYIFSSLENFKVLKGIVFDSTQADQFIVDVQEIAKADSKEITFEVRIWSEKQKGRIRFHYSAQIKLRHTPLPMPAEPMLNDIAGEGIAGLFFYQDKTLFHGSCFQGIERVLEINPETLIMQCRLPALDFKQQGQFLAQTFNPYTADVLIQSILIWLKHFHKVGALPVEIQGITQFKPLSFDQRFQALVKIKLKTVSHVVYDIAAFDDAGYIQMKLSDIKVAISERLTHLFLNSDS